MWRYTIPIAIFAVLFGFLFVGLNRDPGYVPSPLIGKSAPPFSLTTVEDEQKKVSPEDFRGKPFVLNVWGTWCVECRREHDALLEISRQGLVPIVGLNWKDEREQAQQWLRQLGNPYAVTAFDPEGRAGIDWGVYGAPETFLIDANGVIVYKHIAPLTLEVWNREFVPRIQAGGGRS
jgi:cytochrome c biogenesis protein CcmG/thiol:disulfide interchange protein DsbE